MKPVWLTPRELAALVTARDRYTPEQLREYLAGAAEMNDRVMQLPLEMQ